ncbi:MAG: acetyl-CoA carboxylase, biotin carboxyl carrier protein, partial [Planctomycetes bacterium]|nr:acetyl-CoA carboxylase, biotin carboxyl carrier protein [Planctomycetota bacterium]
MLTRGVSGAPRKMELDHIRGLVTLMVDNDLSRIEIREGDTHILLRRGHAPIVTAMPATALAAPQATPAAPAVASANPAPAPAAPASNETLIRSPMVGTFYAKPD